MSQPRIRLKWGRDAMDAACPENGLALRKRGVQAPVNFTRTLFYTHNPNLGIHARSRLLDLL
jgi:hypothetical protein